MAARLLRLPVRMASTATPFSSGKLFLGLDSSTQGLKATLVDERLAVVHAHAINYQRDLPGYGTTNGVVQKEGNVVVQPTAMYLAALDLLLSQMKAKGFPLSRVTAISGSGQQHGSAYWKTGALAKLRGLKAGAPLTAQLAGAFSVAESPIWMDSSTSAQCRALEKAVGGPLALARLTGSRAYERFTGNQIAKIAGSPATRAAYADTERISLISSMMASVLRGDYAPIDFSDGCGMNLLDLRSKQWSAPVMAALEGMGATGLAGKLGAPAPSHTALGTVAPYFAQTYGIATDAQVIAWSGDNPCSVAGLGLRAPGDVAVSLGTSDTVFGICAEPSPGADGHLFANPVDPASYMAMLCYKNGSLTRERVRDAAAGGSWDAFNASLGASAPGNGGALGFYFDQPEITPTVLRAGVRRFAPGGARVPAFAPAVEIRAVVESQFLSMRAHGEGVGITAPRRLIATGGASSNPAITQVLADVFGAPVYVASQTDSASLGAAYRAAHGWAVKARGSFVPFETVLQQGATAAAAGAAASAGGGTAGPIELRLVSSPRAAATAAYTALLPAFKAAEAQVMAESA